MSLDLLIVTLAVATGCAAAPSPRATPSSLDPVVRDVCGKRIVLVGEEVHHAGGATLAVKSELVRRLVDECAFSVVLFESSLAEFVDLQRAFARGTATPAHVADAIGGLWSTARESDPLVETLYDRAKRGKVTLGGLDGQVGSTHLYVRTRLAGELAGYLAEPRRAACFDELDRFASWRYDATSPFGDAARAALQSCLTEVAEVAARRPRSATTDEAVAMARATSSGLLAQNLPDPDGFNVRDRGMYEALRWHVDRLPPGAKIILWCANVHAAKTLRGVSPWVPLGSFLHRDFGGDAAAIGISALAGSYARPNKPATPIAPAPADSLEARAFAGAGATDLRYVTGADLARAPATAHAIAYDQVATLPWHELLDGLIVLREERPPVYIHPRTPRRAAAN